MALPAWTAARLWPSIVTTALASVLSFMAGSATGTVSAYVGLRADLATLAARVTIDDERISSVDQTMGEVERQLRDTVVLLTDLRVRMGPTK